MRSFPESDWRVFKQVRQAALERFCSRVLNETSRLASSPEGNPHEQYLKLYKLIDKRDEQIANAFNDFRRSTAFAQLIIMRNYGMLTPEDLAQFGEETRQLLDNFRRINET
jgi:hypothetical protein